jgi:hypothetical protein
MTKKIQNQTGKIGYVPMTLALLGAGLGLSIGTCNDNEADVPVDDSNSHVQYDNSQRSLSDFLTQNGYSLQDPLEKIEEPVDEPQAEQEKPQIMEKYRGEFFDYQLREICRGKLSPEESVSDIFLKIETGDGLNGIYEQDSKAALISKLFTNLGELRNDCSPDQYTRTRSIVRDYFESLPGETRAKVTIGLWRRDYTSGRRNNIITIVNELENNGNSELVDQYITDTLLAHKLSNPERLNLAIADGKDDPIGSLIDLRYRDMVFDNCDDKWENSYVAQQLDKIAWQIFEGNAGETYLSPERMIDFFTPDSLEKFLQRAYTDGNTHLIKLVGDRKSHIMGEDKLKVYETFIEDTCNRNPRYELCQ